MKQLTMFAADDGQERKYTTAAGSPLYIPKERRPHIAMLTNPGRTLSLLRAIETAAITEDERKFLRAAAHRHTVFNYELIADYYAHASAEMQKLMEQSALVIVDIDDAIELGYVRLCEATRSLYLEEVAND